MDKPEWDKHLDELNVAISHFSNEEREYTIVQFDPHFTWIDYSIMSEEEVYEYFRSFSPNPSLYEILALIFQSIKEVGGDFYFVGRHLRYITIEDWENMKPLQHHTVVNFDGDFYHLSHLLMEWKRKPCQPDSFVPDVTLDEAHEYVKDEERRRKTLYGQSEHLTGAF